MSRGLPPKSKLVGELQTFRFSDLNFRKFKVALNALNNLFFAKSCVLYCQSKFDNKNMGVTVAFLNKHLKLEIKGVVLKAHTTALITYFVT